MFRQNFDAIKEIRARTKATILLMENGLCEENINDIFGFTHETYHKAFSSLYCRYNGTYEILTDKKDIYGSAGNIF